MDNWEGKQVKIKMNTGRKKYICGGFSNEALLPFQEYVLWLRIKYLLHRYEIVDNALLLEYEQELIATLREEIEDEFFWIENCT